MTQHVIIGSVSAMPNLFIRASSIGSAAEETDNRKASKMEMSYGRFAAMIATSTIVMFGLMYLNTYALDHVEFSQTRTWMALVMGAAMAAIMIGFMWGMYKNVRANVAIVIGSIVVLGIALWLVRSQATVGDVSYMKAMIPHHSIAIMTSERAHIRDPEVRKLADRIIDAQIREIAEMKRHIARLEQTPPADGASDLPSYRDKGVAPPPPETDASAGVNTLQPVQR
jgi:uncharacterized protein (DUF305 family)